MKNVFLISVMSSLTGLSFKMFRRLEDLGTYQYLETAFRYIANRLHCGVWKKPFYIERDDDGGILRFCYYLRKERGEEYDYPTLERFKVRETFEWYGIVHDEENRRWYFK